MYYEGKIYRPWMEAMGDLRLAVENNHWKLAALDLRSEERQVVPGSFSSR